ncbi:hypothetical protein H5410_056880 [Solanum commersonii]|uniref:DUF4283 domain-containing protein n=1 Tax=Solanum commersonii TaxID=4109 RepID=A0A9J5WMJ0_SOLCO|nr:hypothetical protein H5410_056880 [Solanum commersonii]
MHFFIYDAQFRINEENTKALVWIPFPNLLLTYFVKEWLFSLSLKMRKEVLVNLKCDFPKPVRVNIINETIGEIRTGLIQIRYDYVPKYCEEYIMQGHNKKECRIGNIQKGGGIRESFQKYEDQASGRTNNNNHSLKDTNENIIENNSKPDESKGERVTQQRESAKSWVNHVFGKQNPLSLVPGTNDNVILVPNKSNVVVQKGEVVDNEKAIMIIPNVVQIRETNSVNVFSLNKVLLDIVSHRPKEGKEIHTKGSMTEADISEEFQHYLLIEEDASPRILKSSKREKKQANGQDNQPIRV